MEVHYILSGGFVSNISLHFPSEISVNPYDLQGDQGITSDCPLCFVHLGVFRFRVVHLGIVRLGIVCFGIVHRSIFHLGVVYLSGDVLFSCFFNMLVIGFDTFSSLFQVRSLRLQIPLLYSSKPELA